MGFGIPVVINGGYINNIMKVQEISRVKDVSIKAFPCPKVNDEGLQGAWKIADLIAMGVTVWATLETWKAAKEEYKIGKRYYDLAKEQWDFFYEHYRPLEEQELAEIWAEQEHYKPDYVQKTQGHTNLIDSVFERADWHRQALVARYCICPDVSSFRTADLMRSTVWGDADNFARRYAEQLAQEKNDIRWQRRIAAASRGRNLLAVSAAFASKAAGFFNQYAQAMSGVAQGAAQFSGYVRNRFRTDYNPVRNRVDARRDVPDTYRGQNTLGPWATETVNDQLPRGGVSWGLYEGNSPYMHSGLDPTGDGRSAERG